MSTLSEQVAALEEELQQASAELRDMTREWRQACSERDDLATQNKQIFSVPRVITADELREGDKYAVIWLHEDGNELVDIVQFFPGHNTPTMIQGNGGWIDKETIVAIVLLENAPEPEPTPELPKVGDRITTARTLDTLPVKAVVLDADGDAWQKHGGNRWHQPAGKHRATSGQDLCYYFAEDAEVFTIIHLPGGGDDE